MQIGNTVYGFPGLPFGWTHSPALAQELLGMYLYVQHPGAVVLTQYLDDVLASSALRDTLKSDSEALAAALERRGWVVSPKSELNPSTDIQWMGKRLCGATDTICRSRTTWRPCSPAAFLSPPQATNTNASESCWAEYYGRPDRGTPLCLSWRVCMPGCNGDQARPSIHPRPSRAA